MSASSDASHGERLLLRDAAADDAPAIAAIYAPHVLQGVATFEEVPPDAVEMARRFESVCAAGHPFLVATLAGRLVGFCYASAWNERSAYRATVQDSIYVDASLHRRGVGRTLLSSLILRCAAQGRTEMMAGIGGGSPPSVALHAALGFRHIGRAEKIGYKFGRRLDVVYMQRSL